MQLFSEIKSTEYFDSFFYGFDRKFFLGIGFSIQKKHPQPIRMEVFGI